MAFLHFRLLIGRGRVGAGLYHAGVKPQPHGAAHIHNAALVGHQVNDRVRRARVELGGIGAFVAQHMAGELHHHQLHPQTKAKIGHFVLAGIAGRENFALDAAVAKAAGHEDAVGLPHGFPAPLFFQVSRVHPGDFHIQPQRQPGMVEGFPHAEVGIMEFHIFAHEGNVHGGLVGAAGFGHQVLPGFPVGLLAGF